MQACCSSGVSADAASGATLRNASASAIRNFISGSQPFWRVAAFWLSPYWQKPFKKHSSKSRKLSEPNEKPRGASILGAALLLRACRCGGRTAGHRGAVQRHALHTLAEEGGLLRAERARVHANPADLGRQPAIF